MHVSEIHADQGQISKTRYNVSENEFPHQVFGNIGIVEVI